jgi:hypothetical protein
MSHAITVTRTGDIVCISDGAQLQCLFPLSKLDLISMDDTNIVIHISNLVYTLGYPDVAETIKLFELIKRIITANK